METCCTPTKGLRYHLAPSDTTTFHVLIWSTQCVHGCSNCGRFILVSTCLWSLLSSSSLLSLVSFVIGFDTVSFS
jgi:hypothetical protein